jgi:hypothetical protein
MGFDFGLDDSNTCFKRKNRWLFSIPTIIADGVNSLPPAKGSRPNISFKEIEAQHLSETVYFPSKPEWKPINITLYDIRNNPHPIFDWLKNFIYDPSLGLYLTACDGFKKPQALLEMYDGCGTVLETWTFESVWPQAVEFGELDMSSGEVVTCDLTFRYDRAYIN